MVTLCTHISLQWGINILTISPLMACFHTKVIFSYAWFNVQVNKHERERHATPLFNCYSCKVKISIDAGVLYHLGSNLDYTW